MQQFDGKQGIRFQEAFAHYHQDASSRFQLYLRRKRAEQLRELLADPDAIDLKTFNREVWAFETQTFLAGRDITRKMRSAAPVAELYDALQTGALQLHGNYIWGSGAHVYGSRLSTSDEQKAEYIHQALRVLNDRELTPIEKAHRIDAIPGFGPNITTGLVMVFHPDEFAIFNGPSQQGVRKSGYAWHDLQSFEDAVHQLKALLGAEDFLDLDLFLYFLSHDQIPLTNHERPEGPQNPGASRRIVKIAPGHEANFWQECLEGGYICVGWDAVGDLRQYPSKEAFRDRFRQVHPSSPAKMAAKANEVWTLMELRPGDLVVANRGISQIVGIGEVIAPGYVWRPERPEYKHTVCVRWNDTFVAKRIPEQKSWATQTVAKVSEELYRIIIDALPASTPPTDNLDSHVWLFQANPAYYNLQQHVAEAGVGAEDEWLVTRYRDEMRAGDIILLWQAGTDAGIHAIGEVVHEPYKCDGREFSFTESRAWRAARGDGPAGEWAVRYRYTRILEQPILKAAFIADPVLREMQVLRAPQGTNFRVTHGQWVTLQHLIESEIQQPHTYVPPAFDEIQAAISKTGLRISERTLRRYHLSLKTRGFVILSGISGTGKTWLAEAYADAVCAKSMLVPVAPDWTTNEDLLGYFNPIDGCYHDTRFSHFLREAAHEYERAQAAGVVPKPYHLILDEMNLARVEYYFAKFLSAMETRARNGSGKIELGPEGAVCLGMNLFFVGTVNVDETTHGFADKVYDRAQLIELDAPRAALMEHVGDATYCEMVMAIWDALHPVAPFAFRVLDEMTRYINEATALGISWQHALDEQLLQKVLPKCKGTDLRIGDALRKFVELTNAEFPLSCTKADQMLEGFQQYGFASFF